MFYSYEDTQMAIALLSKPADGTQANAGARERAKTLLQAAARDFRHLAALNPDSGAATALTEMASIFDKSAGAVIPQPWSREESTNTLVAELSELLGYKQAQTSPTGETTINLPFYGWKSLTWFATDIDENNGELAGWRFSFKPLADSPAMKYLVIND